MQLLYQYMIKTGIGLLNPDCTNKESEISSNQSLVKLGLKWDDPGLKLNRALLHNVKLISV